MLMMFLRCLNLHTLLLITSSVKHKIRSQIEAAAKAVNAVVAMDEDLLEEVTSLVEGLSH